MSEYLERQIAREIIGDYEVSTIRTDAGGAAPTRSSLSPFSSADYAEETPWPFEIMVFRGGRGCYHMACRTEEEARTYHLVVAGALRLGALSMGMGVDASGNPSLTPEEWAAGKQQGTPKITIGIDNPPAEHRASVFDTQAPAKSEADRGFNRIMENLQQMKEAHRETELDLSTTLPSGRRMEIRIPLDVSEEDYLIMVQRLYIIAKANWYFKKGKP